MFAERLRKLIKVSGKSLAQIAMEADISTGAISQYQNGTARPGIDAIINLAKYFNVSADYLLGLSEASTPNIAIQAISKTTGLTDRAIERLGQAAMAEHYFVPYFISALLEYKGFVDILGSFVDYQNEYQRLNELLGSLDFREIIDSKDWPPAKIAAYKERFEQELREKTDLHEYRFSRKSVEFLKACHDMSVFWYTEQMKEDENNGKETSER